MQSIWVCAELFHVRAIAEMQGRAANSLSPSYVEGANAILHCTRGLQRVAESCETSSAASEILHFACLPIIAQNKCVQLSWPRITGSPKFVCFVGGSDKSQDFMWFLCTSHQGKKLPTTSKHCTAPAFEQLNVTQVSWTQVRWTQVSWTQVS